MVNIREYEKKLNENLKKRYKKNDEKMYTFLKEGQKNAIYFAEKLLREKA